MPIRAMNPSPRLVATFKVVGLLLAPLLWSSTTHQLASAFLPGQIKVDHWRLASSLSNLAFGGLMLWLLWRSQVTTVGKVVLSLLVSMVFGFFAVSFLMRSNCEPSSVFIGEKPESTRVSSCE